MKRKLVLKSLRFSLCVGLTAIMVRVALQPNLPDGVLGFTVMAVVGIWVTEIMNGGLKEHV